MSSKPHKVRVPAPYLHKATGQAALVLRDADGRRRTVYLGVYGSAEAARRYCEVLATTWQVRPMESRSDGGTFWWRAGVVPQCRGCTRWVFATASRST